MKDTTKYMIKRVFVLLLLAVTGGSAWAQVTGDQYTSTYSGTTVTNVSITHKSPKWTQYHKDSYNDTYNTADMVTLENNAQVQAANAYVDTIYVHKGTSVTLTLPYRVADSNASIYNYLRWFDYRTDGNYNCGSGDNAVNDLLTPALSRTVYRFANGYATINGSGGDSSITKMDFYYPTDDEYNAISTTNFKQIDNDYYIVACDASIYTDFKADNDGTKADFGSANNWCEPTLASRAIYYIIGVEDDETHEPSAFTHYWELKNSEYQGGTNTGAEHYIDEYEITYPSRRLSNNTAEMVALNKDANAYAIPGTDASADSGTLDVTLIDNANLGFNLTFAQEYTGSTDGSRTVIPTGYGKNGKISGNDRVIFFYKGTLGGLSSTTAKTTVPTDTQWYVNNGDTITILVTKTIGEGENATIYNLARYKVTFSDDANLLTQTQVAGLSSLTGNEGYWWENQTHRSPEYMEETYSQVASLLFDYSESVDAKTVLPNGQEHFYPFPMDWSSNGYAFYDGVTSADANTTFDSWNSSQLSVGTRFSMYSITNEYIGYWDSPNRSGYASPPTNLVKDDSGYWLYIDASERPGAVAEITIDGNLCAGSKLFGTAWIKGAGGANSVDAGALFSIGGVTVNSDGTETHAPILRQATGQVRVTTRITEDDVNEPGLSSSITGKGADTNQWFQVYFSILNDGSQNFDYYTLRVDNYCAGTDGGDYYFDELKVYVLTPTVEMMQLEPLCTSDGDAMSLLRMDLDYETMMSRLGYDPDDYTDQGLSSPTASVDFVIINKAKYYNALAAYDEPTKEQKEEAFKAALVTFWGDNDNTVAGHIFPTLDFYLDYKANKEYDESNPGGNIVTFGDGTDNDEAYFYYRLNGSIVELTMDCYTNMMAYTEYIILLEPHTNAEKTDEDRLDEFIALLDDECAIRAEFYMTASTILKINGETANPEGEYCTGQVLEIAPEVSYTTTDDEGNTVTIYLEDVYFDWFFGSREEYEAANESYGGVSLQAALLAFREQYPDAEELSSTATPPTGDFSENDYKIIEYYLSQPANVSGYDNMLVLHQSHLDVRVLNTGIELIIQPIKVELYDDNGNEIDVCFGYVPVTLMASGDAPSLKTGFHNIESPTDYDPCLRLGLAQLEKCDETSMFLINLCKATYAADPYYDENGNEFSVDHLGVGSDGLDYLYLVDSNDPVYHDLTADPDFTQYDLPVGKIAHLYATDKNETDDETISSHSYMQIYFFGEEGADGTKAFTVKEGYYYVLNAHFEEEDSEGEPIGLACNGVLPLEVKVVPEYLVWTGDKEDNWNNDDHWRRADKSELNKPESDTYITNEANGTDNGYVPMLFSKVIMPRDSEAELYMAGFMLNNETDLLEWVGDEEKEGRTPTTDHEDVDEVPNPLNIMYDLMLYETVSGTTSSFKTEHYRVNLCDQIHLEPGAQVLHSEQLIYNKAWTEVELPQGPWTLQATPLRDVVSGDWYTKKAGSETAEYFTDITWNETDNNRYTPLVYQRSWGTDDNVILENYTGTTGASTSAPSYATTGWSSVYNDTSVPYQVGEGFSLSANLNSSSDNLMFRFPKADEEYTTSSATTFERTGAGTLLISQLVDRSNPDGDDDGVYNDEQGEKREITVTLTQTGNGYYIIGNPFTAPMSMMNFMAENTTIKGYWLESTYGPIVGTTDKDGNPVNSWGTSDVLVDPYCAFFVTTDENDISPLADTPVTVKFTKDMQEETISTTRLEHMKALSLRATNDLGTTSAALLYDDSATDDYRLGEDAILLEDLSWQHEGTPLVYTIAGDMAVGVNRVNNMPQVPLGVFADDDCAYTITFVGVDCLNDPSLFDSYTNTDTPLTEGYVLNMEGASHGRYFIRSNGAATEISLTENEVFDITAYSPTPGTIIVSSTAELEDIGVYSVGGMLLRQVNAGNNYSCTIEGINSGIAIVRAKTSEGTFVKKLRVR